MLFDAQVSAMVFAFLLLLAARAAAVAIYPIAWLLLLPFRLVGIAVEGALGLVAALIFLPARLIRAV